MDTTNDTATARNTLDTLREYSFRSEDANKLARVSLGFIDAMSRLMSDEAIADKVADTIDAVGLTSKARFLSNQ